VTEQSETPKAWQLGYKLEHLKEVADFFRAYDQPYAYGKNASVNEAAIASAAEQGFLRLAFADHEGAKCLVAAMVVQQTWRATNVRGFAGTILGEVLPGDRVIHRVAVGNGFAGVLSRMIVHEVLEANDADGTTWARIWQECPTARGIFESLAFRWRGSKVRASSEILGEWSFNAMDPVVDVAEALKAQSPAEHVTLQKLALHVPDSLLTEARVDVAMIEKWAPHYSTYNRRGTWSALALRGYGGNAEFIIKPSEMSKHWQFENPHCLSLALADTPLRAQLRGVARLVDLVPGVKHRIRLMRLAAHKGELSRHADITDPDAGVTPPQLMRIHIPIVTNDHVRFSQWDLLGGRIEAHMGHGEAWYLDTRKPHTAVNAGLNDRVHLVMDVEANPALLEMALSVEPTARTQVQRIEPPAFMAYETMPLVKEEP
jgi:hypothetical protein